MINLGSRTIENVPRSGSVLDVKQVWPPFRKFLDRLHHHRQRTLDQLHPRGIIEDDQGTSREAELLQDKQTRFRQHVVSSEHCGGTSAPSNNERAASTAVSLRKLLSRTKDGSKEFDVLSTPAIPFESLLACCYMDLASQESDPAMTVDD